MTGGETERSRQGARELIAGKPDVIFATTNTSMAALRLRAPLFQPYSPWSVIRSGCTTSTAFLVLANSGLIFLPDAVTAVHKDRMVAIVGECRLSTVYSLRLFCEAGGLISYGPYLDKMYAGAASYVDRILRGAEPAEMPVQAPTEFELIVNQKTAKQLGLRLPNALLARADEVIE